mgnify:CR=1 FL=1
MILRTLLVLFLWLSSLVNVLANEQIIIVSAGKSTPYLKTIQAYQEIMIKNHPDIIFDVHYLSEQRDLFGIEKNYKVGLALGKNSVDWFSQYLPKLSVVAALIKDKNLLQNYPNTTGVDLQYEPEQQVRVFKKLLPEYHRYGLLYSPAREAEVTALKKLLDRYQLKLIAQRVDNPQGIIEGIKNLFANVDLIWGLPDPAIVVPQTAKALLLASYKEKIPLIGPSVGWVKAGALLGSDWSYSDIADQCVIFTEALLQGKKATELKPVSLKAYQFSVNSKTMRWLKLNELSQQRLKKRALKIYE